MAAAAREHERAIFPEQCRDTWARRRYRRRFDIAAFCRRQRASSATPATSRYKSARIRRSSPRIADARALMLSLVNRRLLPTFLASKFSNLESVRLERFAPLERV